MKLAVTVLVSLVAVLPAITPTIGTPTAFTYEETTGAVEGAFVSFHFDPATGTITDYVLGSGPEAARELTVFTSIVIEDWQEAADGVEPTVLVSGATWAAVDDLAAIRVIDNLVGALAVVNVGKSTAPPSFYGDLGQVHEEGPGQRILMRDNLVTFSLGPGLSATLKAPEAGLGGFVQIEGESFRGFIFVSNGTLEVSGQTVVAKLQGPHAVFFHGLPIGAMSQDEEAFRSEVARAAAEGRVGAVVEITPRGVPVAAAFRTGLGISATSIVEGRVDLELGSARASGTVVVIRVPDEFVEPSREIRVILDGEVLEAVSLEEVLQAAARYDATPLAHVSAMTDGIGVYVWIPHFSQRSLTIQSIDSGGSLGQALKGQMTWLVLGVSAMMVIGLALAIKRLRSRHR